MNVNIEEITIWYRIKKDNHIFNHIENGFNELNKPKPNSKNQQCWNNYKWHKEYGYLIDGKVKKDNELTIKEQLLSYSLFKNGWNFGEGVVFDDKIINLAIDLSNVLIQKFGEKRVKPFPGSNGEILIRLYFPKDYYEFIIESDKTITFIYEKNNKEIEYKDNLSYDEIIDIINNTSKEGDCLK